MELAARIGGRERVSVGFAAAVCAVIGVVSGVQPKLALEVAIGLAFSALVLSSVKVGLAMFTVLSFLEVINVGGAALSIAKVAGLLLFMSWFARITTQSARARSLVEDQPVLLWSMVALASWSAISIAWAISSSAVITGTERFLLNMLLVPIVYGTIRRRDQLTFIVVAFVIGAAASAAWGILQSADASGRLQGAVGDPNEQAAVLVAGIMLAVGVYGMLRKGSTARFWTIVAAVLCALGLVNTVSRGGLVALGATLVAAVIFGGRWRARAVMLGVIGLAAVSVYFAVLAPAAERQHFSSTSSTGRTDLWKVGWKMFAANPVTGVGSGNFPDASVNYVQKAGPLTRADLIVNARKPTHNAFLEILDELGVPGFCAFLLVLGSAVAAAVRAAWRFEREGDRGLELLSRMLVLAILGLLSADVFLSGQYSKQLWLLLALTAPLIALPRVRSLSH